MLEVPVLGRELHERDVLLRTQENLDTFPPDEALDSQSRNRGGVEVIVLVGLQSVLTSGCLPNVRNGLMRHVHKQRYMISAVALERAASSLLS